MPSLYCSRGHLVNYPDTKPAACPVCGISTTPPPVAIAHQPTAPQPARQRWPGRDEGADDGRDSEHRGTAREVGRYEPPQGSYISGDDDLTFDMGAIRVNREDSRPMTVKELRESGTPIERTDDGPARAIGGQRVETVTAAELVAKMVAESGGSAAQSPAPARVSKPQRSRANASSGRKRGGGGKGGSAGGSGPGAVS